MFRRDLDPSSGGTISHKQIADRIVVTYDQVPRFDGLEIHTFQVELFFDGGITISYLTLEMPDAIVGLSEGNGLPPEFYNTDLSEMESCGDRPPLARNGSVQTAIGTPTSIDLIAGDDGQPDPPAALTYIVDSLPTHGTLGDPGAGNIAAVPYTLVGGGNTVDYVPNSGYGGPDSFTFKANDGGIAPDGGDSNIATISITVGGPQMVYVFDMDTDPDWQAEGEWAWGQPTGGGGGEHGSPDPTSGFTGDNVYGYNLSGDYTNNMVETHLTSMPIDCSDLTDTGLKFQRWLGVEQPAYDHAYVRVSNDGSNWTQIWTNAEAIEDSSWNLQELDISAIADGESTVYLRWTIGTTDTSWLFCGWNIDDIEIWGVVPVVNCPYDLDGNGFVGGGDINLIKANYGPVAPGSEMYDLDGNGFIGGGDINLVKANYGPCP